MNKVLSILEQFKQHRMLRKAAVFLKIHKSQQPGSDDLNKRNITLFIVGGIFLTILFQWFPCPFYWYFLFDKLHFYFIWPILMLSISGTWLFVGYFTHKQNGNPSYIPIRYSLGALALYGLNIRLLFIWCIDWSSAKAVAALVIFTCSIFIITLSLFIYGELWRHLFNNALATKVFIALSEENEFSTYLTDLEKAKKQGQKSWISPHCYTLLRGYYEHHLYILLSNWVHYYSPDSDRLAISIDRELERLSHEKPLAKYLSAGEFIIRYLQLDLCSYLQSFVKASEELCKICNEMVTTALSSSCWKDHLILESISICIECLKRHAEDALQTSEVKRFKLAYELGQQEKNLTSIECATAINQSLFDQHDISENDTYLHCESHFTWLSLAHHSLPLEACFDIWLDRAKRMKLTDMFIPYGKGDIYLDPPRFFAQMQLTRMYRHSAETIKGTWKTGMQGRADTARNRMERKSSVKETS